jgi:TfoX/Sxy family transcriptional regulator of competence genes
MPKSPHSEDIIERYEKLVAHFPELARKGAANPYTAINGNMFSFITKEGRLAVRLSQEDRDAFEKKHGPSECVQYGAVMREYVEVPDVVFKSPAAARRLFGLSFDHAKTLKVKPTTRKKATKKSSKKPRGKTSTKRSRSPR